MIKRISIVNVHLIETRTNISNANDVIRRDQRSNSRMRQSIYRRYIRFLTYSVLHCPLQVEVLQQADYSAGSSSKCQTDGLKNYKIPQQIKDLRSCKRLERKFDRYDFLSNRWASGPSRDAS
jgi:hypothetical protein